MDILGLLIPKLLTIELFVCKQNAANQRKENS
jgi:hypothetical protein